MSTTPRAAKFCALAISLVSLFFCFSARPAQATLVTSTVYGANAASSTMGGIAKQIRVDPATGKVYTLGISQSTFLEFSVDGSSASSIAYSTNLPLISNVDFVISNGQMFLNPSVGNFGLYRYDLSGSTANFVASSTWTSGVTSIAFGPGSSIYANKGTAFFPHDFSLNRTAATTTFTAASIHMAYAGGKVYYMSSAGRIASNDLLGNDVTILNAGAGNTKGLAVSNDARAIYYASSTAIRKMATSSASTFWTKNVSLVAMDLNTSTGKIYTVDGGGVITVFDPIGPVSSFTATSSGSSVTLDITSGVSDGDYDGTLICRSTVSYPASVTDGSAVTTTASNTYVDSDLSNGTYYYTAFNKTSDGYYGQGVTTSVTVAVPPDPPVVSATLSGINSVLLSWSMPAGTESFLLKRSTITYPLTTSDGNTVTTTGNTSLVDSGLSDGTYYYSVFARDAQGNYSSAGNASAYVDTLGPSVPSNFLASASGNTINLSWTNPGDSDFSYESIRRSTTDYPATPGDATLVTTTAGISYTDTDVTNGTYYYSIFAYDGRGNYSLAATSSVTVNMVVSTPVVSSPAVVYSAPVASTASPLSFSVGSSSKTTTPSVLLNLTANPTTVKGYAVSLDPNFKNASIMPFTADTKTATLPLPNAKGNYKVYLKYYSETGQTSETLSQTITVSGSNGGTASAVSAPVALTRVLSAGSTGTDVKNVQVFLNSHGFMVAKTGPGSPGRETTTYGPATTKAVIKFQEAHADEILKPLGLKKGTGVLGPATMKVMSSL